MKSTRLFVTSILLLLFFTTGSLAQSLEQETEFLIKNKEIRQTRRLTAADREPLDKKKFPGDDPLVPGLANSNNYTFVTQTNASLTDMSSGTTQLLAANIDDTASALTNIGFDFYFQGVRYTTFSINENGVLRLGATAQASTPYKPLAQAGLPIITAYGADQRTHAGDGKVHFKVTGAAPNRVLTVEWLNNQANFNTGGTADLTYEVRLYESTGVIELVYGSMTMSALGAASTDSQNPNIGFSSSNTAGNVGSVTAAQSGTPAPTFDGTSATPVANLYTAGAITVLTSATDGNRRIFSLTPPVPVAPSNNGVTGIGQLALTLNWLDNASNEAQYAVYRSTDNINFSFVGSAAENATSFSDTALTPGTNYFYRVFAVSEGALSSAATFSTATLGAGNDTCNGAGGNWNTPGTWTDGSVPTSGDNVTIGSGCTVTIDTAAAAFTVTVQSGGTLQYESVAARTLTVGGDVTVNAGGVLQTQNVGAIAAHVLSLGGSLTNNGTIDFSTSGNTAGAGITFTGATNTSFTLGASSTTDLKQTAGVTVNKGTNNTPVLSFNPGGTLTVLGANAVGFLTITNGTFKLDGTGAFSNPLFNAAAYSIPATGGFWMNNPNATVVGLNGSSTLTGLFRMTVGTFNIGTATGNSMGFAAGANINVEGGAINATGRFGVAASGNAITYNQTGGTITVCTIGNASTTLGSFDLGTGVGTTNISAGIIIVQLASTAASGPRDFRNQSGLTGTTTVTGGTLQMGNAASGAAKAFSIAGVVPNFVIDNTSAGHSVTFLAPAVFNNVTRNIIINTGTTMNIGNNVFLMNGASLINNGTLTANGASSNFVWFLTTAPVTYSGTGVATAPVTNFAVQADLGLTLDPAVSPIVCNAVRLFSGSIINANKLTIGNGGATAATVQIGNTTTPTAAGTFDTTPTFNPGTGGILFSYLRTTLARVTGPEVPPSRTILNLTYDDNDITHSLTLSGSDLTITGTLALTNGVLKTGIANTWIHNGATVTRTTGLVDGNLGRTYSAPGIYTYHVGSNGYTPVVINVTAAAPFQSGNGSQLFPSAPSLTVRSYDATLTGFDPTRSLSRNWDVIASGTITADLSFTYLAADVNGNEADYRVYRRDSLGTFNLCPGGPCVNTGTHTVSVTGNSSFSRWTAAEALIPTSAPASVSGRVLTADGSGIRNAVVMVSGGNLTQPRTVNTGTFGFYRFDGLDTGQNYVLTVVSKRFRFAQSTRVIGLQEDLTDLDFVAEP
jgi:hypothetical protein